jgi:ribose transport system substrate-binding protein
MRTDYRVSVAAFLGLVGLVTALGCGGSEKSTAPPVKPGKGSTASGGEKRVIILTNGNSPFWDAGRAGMLDAERDLKLKEAGLKAVMETNDGTDRGQIDKLRQFATQDDIVAVGISVNTAGNEAIVEELRKLQKQGVKIVTLDSDVDRQMHRDARVAFIGTDNLVGGRELGKCAAGLLPEGGEYVTFVGITGAQNARERVGGFTEGAGPKFKSVDNMGDQNDRTRARENVRNAINNHPNLKVLVGIWSYNAPAIVDVVREKNARDRFKIVAFDAEPAAIEGMGNGMIDAMVVQNPYEMGYQAIKLLKSLDKDDKAAVSEMLPHLGKPDGDLYDTGLKVVVPDEGSPLKAEMFNKKTQFLKLAPFREWLKKYNLSMS